MSFIDPIEPSDKTSVTPSASIPMQRVLGKLDSYLSRLDFPSAFRHLEYWLAEARMTGDHRGELAILNELIGCARKTQRQDESLQYSEAALSLLCKMHLDDQTVAGTTYINIATAAYVFHDHVRSLAMFEKALRIYDVHPEMDDKQKAGLYNNLGLTLTALKRYDDAIISYQKALACMNDVPQGALEQAETLLNMANTFEYKYGMVSAEQQIYSLLDRAEELLGSDELIHDGYYAYVCDHCIPTFEHYGYFFTAQKLKEFTRSFYERT